MQVFRIPPKKTWKIRFENIHLWGASSHPKYWESKKVVVEQDDKLLVKYVWQARGERRLIPSISVVLQSLNGQRPTPKLFQRKDEINPNSNCLDSFHFGIIARQNILAYLSACFRWGCIATLLQAAGWGVRPLGSRSGHHAAAPPPLQSDTPPYNPFRRIPPSGKACHAPLWNSFMLAKHCLELAETY